MNNVYIYMYTSIDVHINIRIQSYTYIYIYMHILCIEFLFYLPIGSMGLVGICTYMKTITKINEFSCRYTVRPMDPSSDTR